jgi:hypothetical protein
LRGLGLSQRQLTMQILRTLTLFLASTLVLAAQEIKIERAIEKDLLVSAYSLQSVKEFNYKHIAIKLIEVQFIARHPDNQNQEAAVSDFLLIVKEASDDTLTNADFWVRGQFYNPGNFKFDQASKILSFQHGTEKKPTTRVFVSVKEVKIM